MSSTCSVSTEISYKDVDPTPWIEYVELSPNSTMHANCFSFKSKIATLYPYMCLEAPLSVNNVSCLVMRYPDNIEMR